MNKSNLIGIVIGIGVATAIGAGAGYAVLGDDSEAERKRLQKFAAVRDRAL